MSFQNVGTPHPPVPVDFDLPQELHRPPSPRLLRRSLPGLHPGTARKADRGLPLHLPRTRPPADPRLSRGHRRACPARRPQIHRDHQRHPDHARHSRTVRPAQFFDQVQGTDGFPCKPAPDVILTALAGPRRQARRLPDGRRFHCRHRRRPRRWSQRSASPPTATATRRNWPRRALTTGSRI